MTDEELFGSIDVILEQYASPAVVEPQPWTLTPLARRPATTVAAQSPYASVAVQRWRLPVCGGPLEAKSQSPLRPLHRSRQDGELS